MRTEVLSLALLFSLIFVDQILASDSTSYHVSIEAARFEGSVTVDTVDVVIDSRGGEFAAVDLLVGSNSRFVEITQILRGEICDSCRWEFFNVRKQADIDSLGLQSIWQIVTLAEMMPDSLNPICYGWNEPGSIARLVVTKLRDPMPSERVDSLLFLWTDCSDNSISGRSGVVLAISTLPDTVGFSGVAPMSLDFPNTIAAPGSCIKPDKKDRVKRWIEFERGSVRYVSDSTLQ